MPQRLTCPACGYRTFVEHADYELCPVCYWENDGSERDGSSIEGPNGMTLGDAQRNYERYGVSALHCLAWVRDPLVDESRDPEWVRERSSETGPGVIPDLGALLAGLHRTARLDVDDTEDDRNVIRFDAFSQVMAVFLNATDAYGLSRSDAGLDEDFSRDDLLLVEANRRLPRGWKSSAD